MNPYEKLLNYIAKLKRGTINIYVSKNIDFENADEYNIAKNSAVKIKSLNKKIAFSKFKEFFENKMKSCESHGDYLIKIEYTFEELKQVSLIRYFKGNYYEDVTYQDDEFDTTYLAFFDKFVIEEFSEAEGISTQELEGKTHIVDSIEAKGVLLSIIFMYLLIWLFFTKMPSRLVLFAVIGSATFSIVGIVLILYHWLIKQDYYLE